MKNDDKPSFYVFIEKYRALPHLSNSPCSFLNHIWLPLHTSELCPIPITVLLHMSL